MDHVDITIIFFLVALEPVGSVSPKISTGDDLKNVKVRLNESISLMCPAQAFPIPVYK
jgi:hypothetical protein